MVIIYWNCRHPKLRWRQFCIGYLLSLQFRYSILQVLLSAMEIGQRASQKLVPKEESDGRDIDTLVKQLHGESMSEAVESDMLVDTGSLHQLRNFVIKNVRRKGIIPV